MSRASCAPSQACASCELDATACGASGRPRAMVTWASRDEAQMATASARTDWRSDVRRGSVAIRASDSDSPAWAGESDAESRNQAISPGAAGIRWTEPVSSTRAGPPRRSSRVTARRITRPSARARWWVLMSLRSSWRSSWENRPTSGLPSRWAMRDPNMTAAAALTDVIVPCMSVTKAGTGRMPNVRSCCTRRLLCDAMRREIVSCCVRTSSPATLSSSWAVSRAAMRSSGSGADPARARTSWRPSAWASASSWSSADLSSAVWSGFGLEGVDVITESSCP